MKRSILLLAAFVCLSTAAHAQFANGQTEPPFPWVIATADPGSCNVGQFLIRTDLLGTVNALKYCGSANTWTAVTAAGGGASLDKQYIGLCQNTVGSLGVSYGNPDGTGSADGSVKTPCPSLTNSAAGQLSFADSGTVTVWGSFVLPASLPSSITFTTGIVSGSTLQAYKTRLYTACVTGTQDPTFNSAQTLNFTSASSAGNETVQTISSITMTGCSGLSRLIWKFDRDTTDTSTVALLVNFFRFVGN